MREESLEHIYPSRNAMMSRIKSKDTRPELLIRKLAFRLGYRFLTHVKGLPGTPDLVFTANQKIIFVHGYFWHHHPGCKRATVPKTRIHYWVDKLTKNTDRDRRCEQNLRLDGCEVMTMWECEINNE